MKIRSKITKYITIFLCTFSLFPSLIALSQETSLLKTPPEFNNFKNKDIGFLDFVPLPPNYPIDYFPKERVFTGEMYSKDSKSEISATDDIFVPADYLNILEATFTNTLQYGLLRPKKYASMLDARRENVSLVIQGALLDFQVQKERIAIVKILYRIYDSLIGEIVWEGEIKNLFTHEKLPSSLENIDAFIIGKHQFNFQPQRTLLALVVYNNTVDLMNHLKNTVIKNNK